MCRVCSNVRVECMDCENDSGLYLIVSRHFSRVVAEFCLCDCFMYEFCLCVVYEL